MPSFALEVVAGGLSTSMVSAILNPLDVLKTRKQIVKPVAGTSMPGSVPSSLSLLSRLIAEEGVLGAWMPGLSSSIAREMLYSGVCKGTYPIARDLLSGDGEVTAAQRVAAASLTGFCGSVVANPLDVVKVRLFDSPRRYVGLGAALAQIWREEGALILLTRGVSASAPRGAAIAIGEVATYDQTKASLKAVGFADGFGLHVLTSLITGVVATTVAAPFDLLKSRLMASRDPSDSMLSVLRQLLRHEGPLALLNGWVPTYLRLGPHAILTFPLLEAMRKSFGLDYI